MNLEAVLNNWSEYEKKKLTESTDGALFTCKDWEVEYLKKKIKDTFPFINEFSILGAIRGCCDNENPISREEFVRRVLKKLQMVH